ncbi:MAG: DoxX family protein [Rubritepida sp.]|nr:DoxX family protein [Rubritepida sp.]
MNLDLWAPRFRSVLRIIVGLLVLMHGTQKFLGIPPRANAAPELFSLLGAAGTLEIVGGILMLIGLFTRPVGFVLSGFMAFAYFIAHAPRSIFPAVNGGDAAILYCFILLYFFFAGPGPWSLDAQRKR